jgi:hypothetical protein
VGGARDEAPPIVCRSSKVRGQGEAEDSDAADGVLALSVTSGVVADRIQSNFIPDILAAVEAAEVFVERVIVTLRKAGPRSGAVHRAHAPPARKASHPAEA